MSVSHRQRLKFQSSMLLNTLNRNRKCSPGVKRVRTCLLFPLLLKAAQQLLLSLALHKTEAKGGGEELNKRCFFPFLAFF